LELNLQAGVVALAIFLPATVDTVLSTASLAGRKAVEDYRSPRRFATLEAGPEIRQVLDCASPLALSCG
jgi:hypothetical protein